MAKLNDVFTLIRNGASIKQTDGAQGIPITRIETISMGKIDRNKLGYADIFDITKYKDYLLKDGDILMSHINSEKHLGKTAIYSVQQEEQLIHGMNLLVLRANSDLIIPKYAFYYFNSPNFLYQIPNITKKSVNQASFTVTALKELTIPILPINEQQKIVAIFDLIINLIDDNKTVIKKLEELVKSRFIEMFGDPVSNPMGWTKKQLQDIVTEDCTVSYGIVQTGDEQEIGVPVFRPIDIVNRIPRRNELKKTTFEISNKYKRTILKGRELLITVRANIGDTCIIGTEFAGCNVGRGIVPIRTNESIITLEFLKHLLDNKHLNDIIKSKAKGITLIQLNMEDLREIELIIPPLVLQQQFAAFVESTDKLKFEVQQSLEKLEILKKSLMQQYFDPSPLLQK